MNFLGRDYSVILMGLTLAFALLISWLIDYWLGSTVAVLLILQLSIVMIALQCHSRVAYLAAVIEAISFNFLFTMPRYSLQMFHLEDMINLVVFIVVAFTTSQLAELYRCQQGELKQTQLRNQILLSVSHDLRTPLAGIIGTLTTLKEYLPKLTDTERTELLDSATSESHRLHQYIENLLQATKIQHGALVVRKNPESIVHILNKAMERLSLRSGRISVMPHGPIRFVLVSASLIEQALFNVLDNALRYSPIDDPVTVTLYQDEQSVVIDILDRGEGLSEDEIGHIFDLFYSGAVSQSADTGSGLGLAVAKGLISAHGGSIESVPVSKGCLMRITLPTVNEGLVL
ncbi:sensor histidine kinase [Vibrio cincinnatiensis]|uniref:sensor histidine kinase n=1 Tax=Vibrio cincinnatiensis TaxID=675 RepID=UPI001EDD26E8|nr:ATP-binding protein [Vibrio cincinnatiensis]MCG3728208.1 DUF4118 domain-containing protein [Vibrio cincinnatiensis]